MALAKKHSRTIVVDGSTYRWTIDANDEPGLGIVVELAETPAQRCVTWVGHEDMGSHQNIVTPAVVRHCIVSALEQGWTPDRRGPELRFRIVGASTSRPVPF